MIGFGGFLRIVRIVRRGYSRRRWHPEGLAPAHRRATTISCL